MVLLPWCDQGLNSKNVSLDKQPSRKSFVLGPCHSTAKSDWSPRKVVGAGRNDRLGNQLGILAHLEIETSPMHRHNVNNSKLVQTEPYLPGPFLTLSFCSFR